MTDSFDLAYQFIDSLKQLPFVEKIYLFGSRARGDNRERSDIDLAIECPQASNDDWLAIMDVIENADTLLKIDCVRLDEVDSQFKTRVLHEGKIIYDRKNKTKTN